MYKYYLFGGVILEYYRKGVDYLIYKIYSEKDILKYQIIKHKLGDDPKELLDALSVWFNYVEISEDEYKFLMHHQKDYDENI
jgi:hypothetical protein